MKRPKLFSLRQLQEIQVRFRVYAFHPETLPEVFFEDGERVYDDVALLRFVDFLIKKGEK